MRADAPIHWEELRAARTHSRADAAVGGSRGSSARRERATSASAPASAMLRAVAAVAGPATARASGPPAAMYSARSAISCSAVPVGHQEGV